jgi:hypothetical protein
MNAVVMPFKADAPLIVHPNTVLSFPFSLQGFQAVCRWDPKVVKGAGPMNHNQSYVGFAFLKAPRKFEIPTQLANPTRLVTDRGLNPT